MAIDLALQSLSYSYHLRNLSAIVVILSSDAWRPRARFQFNAAQRHLSSECLFLQSTLQIESLFVGLSLIVFCQDTFEDGVGRRHRREQRCAGAELQIIRRAQDVRNVLILQFDEGSGAF